MRAPLTPPISHDWTLSDGYVVRGRAWQPTEPPTEATLYLHGIQSHGGWYAWSASVLADAGQYVLLPDRRGSGLNPAARGDTPNAARWLADLDELSDVATRAAGVRRVNLVGVSWGGKLALAWARQRPERVGRILLIAPGLFPKIDVGLVGRLRIVLLLLLRPSCSVPIPLDEPELFTDNPAGRAFIDRDTMKLTRVTARFLYQSHRVDRQLIGTAPGAVRSAVTVMTAGQDRIIRNDQTTRWLERVCAAPPTLLHYQQAGHTIEFEPAVEQFETDLRSWACNRPVAMRK